LYPGLQIAQAVHAAFAFAHQRPELVGPWMHNSNYLIVVSVPDEGALMDLISEAAHRGIGRTATREPDLDDELTAVALEPGPAAARLCSSLPLALRGATPGVACRGIQPLTGPDQPPPLARAAPV